MTPADATELLTIAAAFDRRTVGRTDALAWADALRDLDVADCGEAIRAHFRDSTEYLMPAHVRQGVRRIRNERIRAANAALLEPHDVDSNDIPGYLAAARERRTAIADGRPVQAEVLEPADPERVKALLESTVKALPAMPPGPPEFNDKARRPKRRAS